MKPTVKNNINIQQIFDVNENSFEQVCINVFKFQYTNNIIYNKYCHCLDITVDKVDKLEKIPFLPISFFKTHSIKTTNFEPQAIFESSGTTASVNSKHNVKSLAIYEESFLKIFNQFYGNPTDWCVIGLLPSYLERQNSSLVFMVSCLINLSQNKNSGFYLNDIATLYNTILQNEKNKQPTLLFGVTYALLNFAKEFAISLKHTTIIETGGMKGRREELTREEVHLLLKNSFNLLNIHSEYGMTELLSQAYALKDGIFKCPNWMKVLLREEDDPFAIKVKVNKPTTGLINCIDLANLYSCSFIATDDVGRLYNNGSFEVLGRRDNSDIRGCSLMLV